MQLSSSPVSARWAHVRLVALLALVLAGAGALLALASALGLPQGKDTFAFMAAEVRLPSGFGTAVRQTVKESSQRGFTP